MPKALAKPFNIQSWHRAVHRKVIMLSYGINFLQVLQTSSFKNIFTFVNILYHLPICIQTWELKPRLTTSYKGIPQEDR
jgi:hypothetical protein